MVVLSKIYKNFAKFSQEKILIQIVRKGNSRIVVLIKNGRFWGVTADQNTIFDQKWQFSRGYSRSKYYFSSRTPLFVFKTSIFYLKINRDVKIWILIKINTIKHLKFSIFMIIELSLSLFQQVFGGLFRNLS